MTLAVAIEPIVYGPTWARDSTGLPLRPQYTLGFDVIDWAQTHLLQPDGPEAGQALQLTKEQKRFLLWWYAIDRRGRFVYRRGMLRRMKGWGKDPLAAVISAVEFVGPCRFKEFVGDSPISQDNPAGWVQIAAVSKEQTRNTMTLFPGLFSKALMAEHSIDMGKEIIYAYRGRRRIEAVTSSPRALEGGRPTFGLKNESQHWIESNEGLAMAAVMERNADKSRDGSARVLAISNAHAPGEGSDAESDYEGYMQALQDGQDGLSGFLYDSIEAPQIDLDDPEAVRAALSLCRGDSYWVDLDRLTASSTDRFHRKESEVRRFYLNQLHADEDRAFDYGRWRELADESYKVEPKALIVAGFDGSVNDDWTALIATEVATGHQWPIGVWKPILGDDGVWRIDADSVEAAVSAMFEDYNVWLLVVDPYYWTEQLSNWMGRYNEQGKIRVREFKTTNLKAMAIALLAYRQAIQEGQVSHSGDLDLNAGIENAYRKPQYFNDDNGEPLWTIRKERPASPLKIDPAMAAALSWWARGLAISGGALNAPPKKGFSLYVPE